MTYYGESDAEAIQDYKLANAEKAYNAKREGDFPGATPVAAPPAAVPPRPVADVGPDVAPPPAAVAAAPPAGARPSPLPPAPTGPMAGVNPDTFEPTSGPANRENIARAIAMRNGAVPPGPMQTAQASLVPPPSTPSPTVGAPSSSGPDAGETFAEEGNPPIVTRDIKVADASRPPGAAPLPTAPPFGARAPDAVVRQPIVAPPEPEMAPAGKEERALEQYIQKYSNDAEAVTKAQRAIAPFKQKREQDYAEARKAWELRYADFLKQQSDERAYERGLPKLQQDLREQQLKIDEAAEQATLKARLGGRDPEKFFTDFTKQKESAQTQAHVLGQIALARDAINSGVITGTGAGWRIDAAKMQAWMQNNKAAGTLASNTERMQAALNSMLSIGVQNMQGSDPKVSNADVEIARGTVAADPKLQLDTIRRVMSEMERIGRRKLDDFEDQRDYYLKGTRAERAFHIPTPPTAPDPRYIDALLKNRDSKEDREEFDRRFGTGAADLEINRAKRRER
jgi:hypothetical protein